MPFFEKLRLQQGGKPHSLFLTNAMVYCSVERTFPTIPAAPDESHIAGLTTGLGPNSVSME
jgi:hypothetical protein